MRRPRSVCRNRHWLTDSALTPPEISLPNVTAPCPKDIRQLRMVWESADAGHRR